MTREQILVAGPEIVLTIFALLVLLAGAFFKQSRGRIAMPLTAVGLILAAQVSLHLWLQGSEEGTVAMLRADKLACFFNLILCVGGLLSVLAAGRFLKDESTATPLSGEFYSLLLMATTGMMLMAASADLLMVFLGLETFSIALYILAGFARGKLPSTEAAVKYFLLGAFASGFLLFGIGLIFLTTGATDLTLLAGKAQALERRDEVYLLYLGIALLLVGFAFKIAVVPFHQWTPDVYEGSPTPVTAFMSVGSKAAGFAALLRVFGGQEGFSILAPHWDALLWLIAAATMIVGNVVALHQESLKRMLGYSGIAHAGYLLIGMQIHNEDGAAAVLFYLMAYAFTNLGAFTVIILFGDKDKGDLTLQQCAGLAEKNLPAAAAMTLFMISLAGIPLTSGFFAKFFLFTAAIGTNDERLLSLSVIAVLSSVVSVYFYLRPVVMMFMRDATPQQAKAVPSMALNLAMLLCVAGVIGFGLYSHALFDWARGSVVL